MRILIRGTNWLGDAVMTTPALMRLREKFPDAHIAILTPSKLADLWKNHPAIDQTIPIGPDETIFGVAIKLRSEKFDVALVLPNSPRAALEVFLAGIPKRVGYARPWRNFLLTQTIPPRPEAVKMRKRSKAEIEELVSKPAEIKGGAPAPAHQIHEYLHLAAALGANPEPLPPKLFITDAEIENARNKFGLRHVSNVVYGMNPGAEYGPAKRWPLRSFIATAQKIQYQTNCVWILFGGTADANLANQIQSSLNNPDLMVCNAAGRTSLRELMALLKCCRALLTNDTGPMHVAAALDVPVVVPFGSTSPDLTGPFSLNGTRHSILRSNAPCSPCFLRECPIDFRCMNGISVEQAVEAVVNR